MNHPLEKVKFYYYDLFEKWIVRVLAWKNRKKATLTFYDVF